VRLPEERLLVSKGENAPVTAKAKRERVPNGSLAPVKPINPPALADVPATNALRVEAERIPVLPAIAPAASAAVVSSSPSFSRASRRGGTVQPAQLLSNVNPIYPSPARDDGISGAVEVRFKIGTNGDVHDISVVRGPAILAQAALDAVRSRKYKPARVDGVPTETDASAIFDFKLN
jgi:TonB family protein